MEMLNRAIDGAALFEDMMSKVKAGAMPDVHADPEVAAWNDEVDRKAAEKMKRKIDARMAAERVEVQKLSRR